MPINIDDASTMYLQENIANVEDHCEKHARRRHSRCSITTQSTVNSTVRIVALFVFTPELMNTTSWLS